MFIVCFVIKTQGGPRLQIIYSIVGVGRIHLLYNSSSSTYLTTNKWFCGSSTICDIFRLTDKMSVYTLSIHLRVTTSYHVRGGINSAVSCERFKENNEKKNQKSITL